MSGGLHSMAYIVEYYVCARLLIPIFVLHEWMALIVGAQVVVGTTETEGW